MHKFFLTLLLAGATIANAQEVPPHVAVYIQYERLYLNNDAGALEHWLAPDAELSETLHANGKSSTHRAPTSQFLSMVKAAGRPSASPASAPSQVSIAEQSGGSFCASSTVTDKAVVRGKNYNTEEQRKVCFSPKGSAYQVTSHSTEVFYKEAAT
jgi:hypothetical protein